MTREENLAAAKEWFIRLDRSFAAAKAIRHLDGNIQVEYVFRDLLNAIYWWALKSANFAGSPSQDSFDLADTSARIAVQVTTTMDAAKIRKTLETFIANHQTNFERLIFVYPAIAKTETKADFSKHLNGFAFDAKLDRLGLSDLLADIADLSIDRQNAVVQLIAKELKPLGAALQMGVDPNVEAIISIIRRISQEAPDPENLPELKPDALKKLERFAAHAEYLKRQFTNNVECYIAVAEAREAAGYDTARAAKCSAWLREASRSALETNGDDAHRAFEALVTKLHDWELKAGRDCEENAVRYFLADEFGRCNVFPNPR